MPGDGNKTKTYIMECAYKLFEKNGYQKVSIRDICDEAGIKRATFYYHFKTKDALLDDFYTDLPMRPEYFSKIAGTENCWLKLWLLLKPSIDKTASSGPEIISALYMLNLQEATKNYFSGDPEYLAKTFEPVIELGQKKGQFNNPASPDELVPMIIDVIIGVSTLWCIERGAFDEPERLRKNLINLLMVSAECVAEQEAFDQELSV